MKAAVVKHDERGIAVAVLDNDGCRHKVILTWDGKVDVHTQDRFPHSPEERTAEENAVMHRVDYRAMFEAQQEFPDADIIRTERNPSVLERALEATQQMDDARFEREFREYHEAVTNTAAFLPEGVPIERANSARFRFSVTPDNEYGESGNVQVLYVPGDGDDGGLVGTDSPFPSDADVVALFMPPLDVGEEFTYPEDFFGMVQANLVYQIRDLYEQMGEEPPEPYQVEGYRVRSIPGGENKFWLEADADPFNLHTGSG